MALNFPIQNPDILGFSPPLIVTSPDKRILFEYKEAAHQSLSVGWERDVDPDTDSYLDYLFAPPQRLRLEAMHGLSLCIHYQEDGSLTFQHNLSDGFSDDGFAVILKNIELDMRWSKSIFPLTDMFPEPEAKPFIRDLEELAQDAKILFPNKTIYNLVFWTLTEETSSPFHTDIDFVLGRSFKNFATETVTNEYLTCLNPERKHFECNDFSKIQNMRIGYEYIFNLAQPHRLATSSPPHRPRFYAGAWGTDLVR